jgi:hypothetical protein
MCFFCDYRVSFSKIERVNIEGCEKLTDNTFKYLFSARPKTLSVCKNAQNDLAHLKKGVLSENCSNCLRKYHRNINVEEFQRFDTTNFCLTRRLANEHEDKKQALLYFNASGCHSLTDETLRYSVYYNH